MTRRVTVLTFLVAVTMVYGLYEVEAAMRDLHRRYEATSQALERERESIRVLTAEWSYLNQPSRLQELADRHLDLVPLTADQVVAELPPLPDAPMAVAGTEGALPQTEVTQVTQASVPLPAVKPLIGGARIVYVGTGGRHVD